MRPPSCLPLRIGGVMLAALGVFPLAALIKFAPVVQWVPAAAVAWLVSVPLLVVVCLLIARALGVLADERIDRLRFLLLAPSPREFTAWAALIVLVLSLFFVWFGSGGLPTGGDEMTQVFQAKILLRGRLWAVAEPYPEFFAGIQSVTLDGRWFSQFPIGGPALLALGAAINAAWLVNPILTAWATVSLYRFASQTTDEATARGATVLFVFSPFVVLMAATQMNHTATLALTMFALAELPSWVTSADPRRVRRAAVCIGLAVAGAATIRPYDAVLMAAVIGAFQLATMRGSPLRQRSLLWQCIAGLAPVTFVLIANSRTTGHPFLFGYDALNGIAHRPGFHVDPTGNDFTPFQGLHHISSYLIRLNVSLFDGPLPGLVVVIAALMLTRNATRWDYLLLGMIGALVVGYSAYWAEGYIMGLPRFLYLGIPAFILFAARMPAAMMDRLRRPLFRRAVPFLLPVSVIVAWTMPPGRMAFIGVWNTATALRVRTASELVDVPREVNAAHLSDALVIVHESWHGRLTSRLRAIGAPALTAESIVRTFDACALQRALDAEDSLQPPVPKTRMNRVVLKALMAGDAKVIPNLNDQVALAGVGGVIAAACVPQLDADRAGATSFELFLPYARWDGDGRLGGRVVFARDQGLRNSLLLSRFGDRTWYRYRPRTGPNDRSPVFIPYHQGIGGGD